MSRTCRTRNVLSVLAVISCVGLQVHSNEPLTFEAITQMSDRIIVGTNLGPSGEQHTYPNGVTVYLGIKDPATKRVFTPYHIRVSECTFDPDKSCRLGETEIYLPGGTVYDTINGVPDFYTTEIARAPTLPPKGTDVVLFMKRFYTHFIPINDVGARLVVDTTSASPRVQLRFASPQFMSAEGPQAALQGVSGGDAQVRPAFAEAVPLDQLKDLVNRVRGSKEAAQPIR